MKIIFEYENPDYKILHNISTNQYNHQQISNTLNQHKIKNVIGRKNELLSQIQESRVDPTQEEVRGSNLFKKNKSSFMNSVNQSQNESFQRRGPSFNRGNTTLGNASNVFRTLLIQVHIDRIVFGYVRKGNHRMIFRNTPTRRSLPSGTSWTSQVTFRSRIWAETRSSSRGL